MSRLKLNGLKTTLGGSLTNSATAITFGAALTYSNGMAVPTLAAGERIALSILDASGNLAEVVDLTAYTTGATTGTIVRGREGTTGISHSTGVKVIGSPPLAGDGLGRVLLKEFRLTGSTTSVTFSSSDIPSAGYADLQIEAYGRTDSAVFGQTVRIAFNGDTTDANYESQYIQGASATATSNRNGVPRGIGLLAGASASANTAGSIIATIKEYLGTTFYKQVLAQTINMTSSTNSTSRLQGVQWANTAAITSITLDLNSAGSLLAGTVIRLYAIP